MAVLQLEKVSKAYGAHDILINISWNVDRGNRIGLVGRNGCGKTTLLHVLTQEIRPDSGSVHPARSAKIGYLAQDPSFADEATVISTVMEGFEQVLDIQARLREFEARMSNGDHDERTLAGYSDLHAQYEGLDGYTLETRAAAVLDGLGFSEEDHGLQVSVLSGGQKNRLALARLLASQPDLLLLDEPTNHLDLRAIEWLEKFLSDYDGTFIVVSHDRYFLDRTVKIIIEMQNCKIKRYTGNYSAYSVEKAKQLEQQQKTYESQQAEISRTEDYIRRNIAGQKTKQAKSRRKALEKLGRVDRPSGEKAVSLKFGTGTRGGDRVIQVEDITKAYDGGDPLFPPLSMVAWRGDRIGIVGPNGSGKTTLLKMLIEAIPPDTGWVRAARSTKIGYYEQGRNDLNPENTVLQELWTVTPGASVGEIRTFLGAFLFSGDEVEQKIESLSGGEQSRVALAKIVRKPCNFLVLDEPTNHLDIRSCEALETALNQFDGTIITVSHDRYFMNNLINRLLLIEETGWRLIDGNYASLGQLWTQPSTKESKRKGKGEGEGRQLEKQTQRAIQKLERRAQEIESEIAKLEEDLEAIDAETEKIDSADWQGLGLLTERKQTIQSDIEERYAEWEIIDLELKSRA
ncbi:MAG: ABC-F family ATP-binding cassette domain-containing protein [Candidatus Latescibacterota bacterium]|nr:ABC-F family ATP-binding cassette domain-containing protein [Candidatus Latescibacterota bacterium]